jgi:hypothetical protein
MNKKTLEDKYVSSEAGFIIAGNRIYKICPACRKLVQVNKFLLGDLHICVPEKQP